MSLLLRSSEKTSRLDFVHPWRLTGLSFIWWSGLNITTIQYPQRHPAGFRSRSQSRASVGFTWEGFDEMDEVSGDRSAELLDDGSIEIDSPITTATKPFSRPSWIFLQQPARAI